MAEQEYEPHWEVTLRRAGPGSGDGDSTGMYEVICGKCGDDPALDYGEVPAGLRRIRGPYPLMAGVAVFLQHSELHDPAGETAASRPARPGIPRQRGDEQVNEQ